MRKLSMIVILLLSAAASTAASDWRHPLYLANGGYWRQRVQVEILNELDREAAGDPVDVAIGRGEGEADLVGALAEAVRVCDADGAEMLFGITGPDGRGITKGPIPDRSTLTVPAECPANGRTVLYVYFDNPAAWPVPDFLEASLGVRNGGLEEGARGVPTGWRHDAPDVQHEALWATEDPHSGARCLKTVVAEGADPTWIATRQGGIHIVGAAKYTMRAWVKAEGVEGYAGWYIHVGNADDPMLVNQTLDGGGGTYDWKQVSAEFTAPEEANRASLGTVLRGTGKAWFDDVTLECLSPLALSAAAARPERIHVREVGGDAEWPEETPGGDMHWDYRVPIEVMNLSSAERRSLVRVDAAALNARLSGKLGAGAVRLTDGSGIVPHYMTGEALVFEGQVSPWTLRTYYLYHSAAERAEPAPTAGYADLLKSRRNLVRNGSFELGMGSPTDWPGSAEGERPAGTTMDLDEPGIFGRRSVKLHIPHGAEKAWTGWRQGVPVEPGKSYLYAAWVKCEDLRGSVQIHAHYRSAAGELCETKQYAAAGPAISGTTDWTLMSGIFEMPQDCTTFQLHLTMLATGTVWHDGVLLAEAAHGLARRPEPRREQRLWGLTAWPVNAIVKVFHHDLPPSDASPARISAARNEKEPLQLAVRSPEPISKLRVEVDPPSDAQGARLTDVQVGIVGYVPIDHKSSYYSSSGPPWHRKYPTGPGGSDGWPGLWPDPLLPQDTFDLPADTTQAVWVTVSVPKRAAAGDYEGEVKLISGRATLKKIPFTVHVWDFELPDESRVAAIYDVRLNDQWRSPGKSWEQVRQQLWRFMAEHRVCPDTIEPSPIIRYENGRISTDFTEFDKAAEYYFDVLGLPHAYTPWYFFLTIWGHPPREKFGEKPYEGEYPYEDANPSELRPEFKKAYQACLKAYWDHMKEKGWSEKCVLYISDEPRYASPRIREQMKALCDMIHEVDPEIPIYASTWAHVPDWDGYIDVWGIGHYGVVSPEKMSELRAAGDRLWYTTDGHMCTDTPYCAIERLLPHYCFHHGVEAYEFWGISWLTYEPYEFGWHAYIRQSSAPGRSTWVRYPNGDGFLAYPGVPVDHDGPVSSIRLEQAREGVEDYEYLHLLRELVAKAEAEGVAIGEAADVLAAAAELAPIPNAGGRYSTRILPDPGVVFEVKERVAKAIEELGR